MADNHIKKLSSICRLCRGEVIAPMPGYVNPKTALEYKEEIRKLFLYDVSNDWLSIHPQTLCGKCARQLKRVTNPKPQTIAEFETHSESDCAVCSNRLSIHSYKVSNEKLPPLPIKIVESAKRNGFIHAENLKAFTFIRTKDSTHAPIIDLTLYVTKDLLSEDYRWQVIVFDKILSPDKVPALKTVERLINIENVDRVFEHFASLSFCTGNNDLQNLIAARKEDDENTVHGNTVLEDTKFNLLKDVDATIRHKSCDIILAENDTQRCQHCQTNRKYLQKMERRRSSVEGLEPKAKKPHKTMTKQELKKRLKTVGKENKELKRKQRRMEKKIEKLVKAEGVQIKDKGTQQVIDDVMAGDCPFDQKSKGSVRIQQNFGAKISSLMLW